MKSLRIHPATFLFLILLLITGYGSVLIPYMISIIIHELSHATVAKKLGYCLDKIWILPYGASISFKEHFFNPEDEVKIAIAGPLSNVILLVLTVSLWWIFPPSYVHTYSFAISNFSIAAFNLLPAFPLDGGRVLNSILKTKLKASVATKISTALNFFFSVCFLILFVISCFHTINFSFGLVAVFLFIGIIEGFFQGTYYPILSNLSKRPRQILAVKSFCVSSAVPLYKVLSQISRNKLNIIYVRYPSGQIKIISEEKLKKVLEESSLEKQIGELLS